MSQARELLRNTAFLGAARVIERLSRVVLVFLIARSLGASSLGAYSAALVFAGLFSTAGDLGIANMLIRNLARDKAATTRYLSHLGPIAVVVSAAAIAAAWLVVPHLGLESAMRQAFLIVSFAVVPGTLRVLQEAVFIAHQRVWITTVVRFVGAVALIAATAILVSNGAGIASLLGVFVGVQWFIALTYTGLIAKMIAPVWGRFRISTAREQLRELRAFAGISVLAALFAQPEVLILAVLAGSTETGYFVAATRIVMIWELIPQTFMTNVFPVLSRNYKDRASTNPRVPQRATKYLLAAMLPISLGLIACAEPIVDLVFGSGFESAVELLRILALVVPILAVSNVLWRVLMARDRQGQLLGALAAAVVVRIVLGVALVSAFLAKGAAVSSVAVLGAYAVALWVLVERDGISLPVLRLGARFAIAALVMGAVTWLLVDHVELWLLVPIAAAVYSAGVWLLRGFSHEDLALFRTLRRPQEVSP